MSGDMFAGAGHELLYPRPYMVFDGLKAQQIMDGSVKASEVRVYIALSSHCRADWIAWPSRKRLQALTGLKSERSVDQALKALLKLGWIDRAGATPGGVVRYRLGALPLRGDPRTKLHTPPALDCSQKGEGTEGRSSLEEGAPQGGTQAVPSTQDWEEFSAFWPGPQTKEARGRYFALARETGWLAKDIRQRAECFLEFQKDLDRTTPTLAGVLDPSFLKLGDRNLQGMQSIADEEKQRRTRRRG